MPLVSVIALFYVDKCLVIVLSYQLTLFCHINPSGSVICSSVCQFVSQCSVCSFDWDFTVMSVFLCIFKLVNQDKKQNSLNRHHSL